MGTSLELKESETPANLLTEIGKCRGLETLPDYIPHIPKTEWVWIDIFIGNIFKVGNDSLNQNLWDAAGIWRETLSNWEPYFN